jgi:hypothetical protein
MAWTEIPDWLYEGGEHKLWVFLLLTVAIGCTGAWVSGKAIAQTWRPFWQLPGYVLLLVAGVRFLHYALFWEPLLPIQNWAVDYIFLFIAAALGYRRMRSLQISTQYCWLFEPRGPLGWRRKAGPPSMTAAESG